MDYVYKFQVSFWQLLELPWLFEELEMKAKFSPFCSSDSKNWFRLESSIDAKAENGAPATVQITYNLRKDLQEEPLALAPNVKFLFQSSTK